MNEKEEEKWVREQTTENEWTIDDKHVLYWTEYIYCYITNHSRNSINLLESSFWFIINRLILQQLPNGVRATAEEKKREKKAKCRTEDDERGDKLKSRISLLRWRKPDFLDSSEICCCEHTHNVHIEWWKTW